MNDKDEGFVTPVEVLSVLMYTFMQNIFMHSLTFMCLIMGFHPSAFYTPLHYNTHT